MKKKNKIIIGVILGIAFAIVIISFLYPPVFNKLARGTFGKADKYRQEQMTENDVQLRSDFVKDTTELRKMITGLIYFTLFTDNLSMTIDTCLESYRLQGFDKDPANTQAIGLLKDYSAFLKNSSPTLANTTRMLAAFLLRDTLSSSQDVEKNIKEFANYVNQINQKDSVLMLSLARIDSYLIGNKALQQKQEELRNLKAIRDQLVIKSTQFMAMTGNKKELGAMLSQAIQSQSVFNGIGALNMSVDKAAGSISSLSVLNIEEQAASSNLGVAFNASSLQNINTLGAVNSKTTLNGGPGQTDAARVNSKSDLNVIIYNKANLQMVYCSADNLKVVYGAAKLNSVLCGTDPNMGSIAVVKGKELGVILNANVFCSVLSSKVLGSVLSASQLNVILPAKDLAGAATLQNAFGSNAGLQMSFGSNSSLQYVVGSSPALQSLFNSKGSMNGFSNLQNISLGVR
jgi:hypothetical protein